MKVLMITGDRNVLTEGTVAHERYKLQAAQVDALGVVYWGRGALWPQLPKEKFDVVTVQDPFLRGLFAWRAAKRLDARFNVQVHTDLDAQPLVRRALSKIVLRRAGSVRVVSERVKAQVERAGIQAPIHVLPVFIDKEAIRAAEPVDLKSQFPQFDKIVFVASRLEPEKNVELAIKAMPAILHSVPNAGLLIAGGGSQLQALQVLVKKLTLEDSVIFGGHIAGVFSYYKSADLVLNTSTYEGFGATIVEALAAGCAVVSTDVGVAKEAGAIIASKREIGKKAAEALRAGSKGELKLTLPPALEWAQAWKQSLI